MYYLFRSSSNAKEIGAFPQIQQFDPNFDVMYFQNSVGKIDSPGILESIRLSLKLEKNAAMTDVLSCSFFPFPLINENVKTVFSGFQTQYVNIIKIAEVESKSSVTPYYIIVPVKPAYEYLDLGKSVFARYNPASIAAPSEFESFTSVKDLEMAMNNNMNKDISNNSGMLPLVVWKPVFKAELTIDIFSLYFTFSGRPSLFISNQLRECLIAKGITGVVFEEF